MAWERYAIEQTTASRRWRGGAREPTRTQVAARNRAVQREKEAKDRVANATTIRRKSEQIVVETLKPREEDDSDTDTDDDDENLKCAGRLARAARRPEEGSRLDGGY